MGDLRPDLVTFAKTIENVPIAEDRFSHACGQWNSDTTIASVAMEMTEVFSRGHSDLFTT